MPKNSSFSLLIKPASADCNLRCDYCFYLEKEKLYPETGRHRMADATLETLISKYMATRQPVYSFGWQGGEPTLMGADFFMKVTALQEKYGRSGSTVSNGVQTNGTRVTPELARHFAQYQVLVGISIDGPRDIHDVYRKKADGGGSYADVIAGLETLFQHKVEVNALTLVSKANVDKPEVVYGHVKELGLNYHQYIPCVEVDAEGNLLPYSITGEEWGAFLIRLFEIWLKQDVYTVSIRNFDAVLQKIVNNQIVMCSMDRNCSSYFLVEHNGDVYPCDFFVEPELLVGNIHRQTWRVMQESKVYRRFGRKKCEWSGECARCEILDFCAGDCVKHRIGGKKSLLCSGITAFHAATLETFKKIANNLKARQ